MQAFLEKAMAEPANITGVTLDLRKCFNLIRRLRIKPIFRAMGFPQQLIDKWFLSLQKLVRYWDIDGFVSPVIASTTGCPEGDCWSVLAMVAIANVLVSAALTRAPSASTTAYADNWTWWSAYFADHQFLLQHTVSFCNILGLQIDWNKTWVWSTKTKGEISVANLIEQQTGEKVDIQRTATDLGCPLSYHGNNLLGTLRDRLQEAKNRLMRIQRSSSCILWV